MSQQGFFFEHAPVPLSQGITWPQKQVQPQADRPKEQNQERCQQRAQNITEKVGRISRNVQMTRA
ncbi:hypothetical protein, partial [Candidatus Amarobacter glycogenicus]|uniref:hypothetical protein n=1 Tax=Candidatus Amarobacter glycogenicus TaxID=3140699 RepID=UPI0031CC7A6C